MAPGWARNLAASNKPVTPATVLKAASKNGHAPAPAPRKERILAPSECVLDCMRLVRATAMSLDDEERAKFFTVLRHHVAEEERIVNNHLAGRKP